MTDIGTVFNRIQIILFLLTVLLAIIYIIPILLVRRFHNVNNVFTVNICFAAICCCTYWLFFYMVAEFSPQYLSGNQNCIAFDYFQTMCTIQVPLAVVEASVHRLCSIVYHTKLFFRKKRWAIICIVTQWTLGILLSLPRTPFNDPTCGAPIWKRVYTLIVIVIIPSLICLINNVIIFNYVRSSTNRIQPTSTVIKNNQHQPINGRDLHLLRHMIVMLCIFVGGWSPIYIYIIVVLYVYFTSVVVSVLILLAEFSLLFDIINLFLYNHELRRYLQDKIFQRH